jgi:hypothetical protein
MSWIDDIDPVLRFELLGDGFTGEIEPEHHDDPLRKFFENCELEKLGFEPPEEDGRFAKAHSVEGVAAMHKACNPWPLARAADRMLAKGQPTSPSSRFVHRDISFAKREAISDCLGCVNRINGLVEYAKGSGVPPPTGSIESQISKLASRMSAILSDAQIALVAKALRALDFPCVLEIFNQALEEAA